MTSLEREQKQIDCQADVLEVELRRVMNQGKEHNIIIEIIIIIILII